VTLLPDASDDGLFDACELLLDEMDFWIPPGFRLPLLVDMITSETNWFSYMRLLTKEV